jgi:hypothetical protein
MCICGTSQLRALQELDVLYNGLFTGDRRNMQIASITFGVLRSSVTRAQRTSFCTVLELLNDVVVREWQNKHIYAYKHIFTKTAKNICLKKTI